MQLSVQFLRHFCALRSFECATDKTALNNIRPKMYVAVPATNALFLRWLIKISISNIHSPLQRKLFLQYFNVNYIKLYLVALTQLHYFFL